MVSKIEIGDTCVMKDHSGEVWNFYRYEKIRNDIGWVLCGQALKEEEAVEIAKVFTKKKGNYLGVHTTSNQIIGD